MVLKYVLIGAFLGYFVFHPFVMILGHSMRDHQMGHSCSPSEIIASEVRMSFSPGMLPWGITFTIFSAFIGLLYGRVREYEQLHIMQAKMYSQQLELDVKNRTKELQDTVKKLEKLNLELKEANNLKDLFTDIMRHDLLNPIGTARSFVELLLEDEDDPEKTTELQAIKRSLDKAIDLIESASKLSKLESSKSLELEDMDLRKVIEEAVERFTPLASEAGMKIENRIAHSMPVRANSIIEEVFANLISNAIKYAPEGRRIVLTGEERDSFWRIRVIDFGEGVKDENKQAIFERFIRKEKRGVKGSGMGLAIARRIVELHNGRIWVEDNPEGGAVFIVEIPKK
ncbi:sensor histidine kinase [Candidatus Pyrohabitans sp.]